MTVTTTANSILYAGNDTVKAFAFPYIFFAPTDLHVTLVDAAGANVTPPPVLNGAATYDYTVTGVVTHGEYASGGTVTFVTAPPAGYTVSLVRAVPALQTVTLIDNTKFPADTVNTEFDKLTVLAQQSAFQSGVALQIPGNEVGLIVIAAPVASRANKLLLWDAAGNLSMIDTANIIGGSVPGGPAGGDLTGSYPNPTVKPSVSLSGTPSAPTATAGTNTTQLATTAFVGAAIANLKPKVTKFAASGTFTPDANCVHGYVVGIGGGGGAASLTGVAAQATGGGGGASGNTVTTFFTLAQVLPTVAVTIGAGGAGGTSGGIGASGGDTFFGSLLTAKGGGPAPGGPSGGVPNAVGNIGTIVSLGFPGGPGMQIVATAIAMGGNGGGRGGGPGASTGGAGTGGTAGLANSGGGAGGTAVVGAGGPFGSAAGGSGYLYVVEYLKA
jgi:hypothetical protein